MLVNGLLKTEDHRPRRWSVLAGAALLALAVVGGGVTLRASADEPKKPAEEKKRDGKKPDDKKQPDPPNGLLPELERMLGDLDGLVDPETLKLLQQQMALNRKMFEKLNDEFMKIPGAADLVGPGGLPPGLVPGAGLFPGGGLGGLGLGGLGGRPRMPNIPALGGLDRKENLAEPRLGARIDKPSDTLVDQLDLPRGQGLILEDVPEDSVAAKLGLKKHDILLELAGKPVPNDVAEFNKMLKDVKSNEVVDAVILRKTRKETIKGLKLP